jgi:hypothetical protein
VEIQPDVSLAYRARAYSRRQLGDAAGAERDVAQALAIETPKIPVQPVVKQGRR